LQLLSLYLHSVRDVHQLCFHAFMMTSFAAHYYASSEIREQPPVVLRDWCFVELIRVRKHLGFRVIGKLVAHSKIDARSIGENWNTSEVRGIYSDSVVVSDNMTLYRLEGPASPDLHNAQSRLADIMQPFCQTMWPPNAHLVLNEVSAFFADQQAAAVLAETAQRA
jgi:hypothetical protein